MFGPRTFLYLRFSSFLSFLRAFLFLLVPRVLFSAAPAQFVAQGIISFLQREAERVPRTTRAGHVFDLLFPDIEDNFGRVSRYLGKKKRAFRAHRFQQKRNKKYSCLQQE